VSGLITPIRADLDSARVIHAMLKGAFENHGYSVYLGGSTLVYGSGRDVDILLLRKAKNAIKPSSVLARLRDLGFVDEDEEFIEDEWSPAGEWAFVGTLGGRTVDVAIVGWAKEAK
jgi:hypothetical protein